MSVDERRIAVIGTGKIGEALIKGLCASGWRKPGEIVATDIPPERLQSIKERCGVETTDNNREAIKDVALIVLAVGNTMSAWYARVLPVVRSIAATPSTPSSEASNPAIRSTVFFSSKSAAVVSAIASPQTQIRKKMCRISLRL